MSVQSTHDISREEAERMFVEVKLQNLRKGWEDIAKVSRDYELEDEIESAFDNYRIVY